jgi:folate-binding protein YgfZ
MSVFKIQSDFITLKGNSVKSFLQGIITNDVNKLTEGNAVYSLLLNNRGKFLYDFFLYQVKEDEILIEYHSSYQDDLINTLSIYNLHKKIEIIKGNYNSYISLEEVKDDFEHIFANPINKELGFKIITTKDIKSNEGSLKEYEIKRIKKCIPDCSVDLVSGSSFPLEYNLYSAFSFNKGCYIGQEVVLRFRLPESLKRKIFVIHTNDKFPIPQTELNYNNEKIGEILSNCEKYGLALLEKDKIPNEEKITCEGFSFKILSNEENN